MTVRKTLTHNDCFYFCTFTCYSWLHLFRITNIYKDIYDWFDLLLNKKRIKTSAYVIMPNHLHTVIYVPDSISNINQIISNGKRFFAYELVKQLKIIGEFEILEKLEQGVSGKDKARGKLHQVFEESMDLKVLNSDEIIAQKINYIHLNPVSKHWNLVGDYREYEHSSAGFYEGMDNYKGYKNVFIYSLIEN